MATYRQLPSRSTDRRRALGGSREVFGQEVGSVETREALLRSYFSDSYLESVGLTPVQMELALWHKFTQHKSLKKLILDTEDRSITFVS